MKLESTTYHYAAERSEDERGDAWPNLPHGYTTQTFRPDHLSFDVHVTQDKRRVKVQNIAVSGFRILKDGTLSGHRIHESYYESRDLPGFVTRHVQLGLAAHVGHG